MQYPFEQNKGYSQFAVYTMLTCGGDYGLAASRLRSLGFGSDSLPESVSGVDISGIVNMSEDTADERPVVEDPGPIPEELFRVPGLVQSVCDFTMANAPYPNLGLAFCGASVAAKLSVCS